MLTVAALDCAFGFCFCCPHYSLHSVLLCLATLAQSDFVTSFDGPFHCFHESRFLDHLIGRDDERRDVFNGSSSGRSIQQAFRQRDEQQPGKYVVHGQGDAEGQQRQGEDVAVAEKHRKDSHDNNAGNNETDGLEGPGEDR